MTDRTALLRFIAELIVRDAERRRDSGVRLAPPPQRVENAPDASSTVRPLLNRPAAADVD